jgi:DHA1 family multidrug resistance protein-like MFS transporter
MSFRGYSLNYVLLCVIAFLMMLATQITNPLLSIFAKEIGATGVWIGYAVSAYWVSRVVLEIPSGYMVYRFGYFKPMTLGVVLTAIANVLTLWAYTPSYLIVMRAIMGLGAPLFFAVSMTFIINMFDVERRGSAMGLFQGIEFVGTIVGSGLSGAIIEQIGFHNGFLLSAVFAVIGLVLLVIPRSLRNEMSSQIVDSKLKVSDLPKVISNRILLFMGVVTLASFIMNNGLIFTVFPLYANENLGLSLTDVGFIMGARSVGYVISLFVLGRASDIFGRKPVLIFGIVSTSLFMMVLSSVTSFTSLAGLLAIVGFTSGAIWIVGPVISAEAVDPSKIGAAVGVYRTFFDLGSVLGPIVMMDVFTVYGVTSCFYLGAGFLLASVSMALLIKPRKPKPEIIA